MGLGRMGSLVSVFSRVKTGLTKFRGTGGFRDIERNIAQAKKLMEDAVIGTETALKDTLMRSHDFAGRRPVSSEMKTRVIGGAHS